MWGRGVGEATFWTALLRRPMFPGMPTTRASCLETDKHFSLLHTLLQPLPLPNRSHLFLLNNSGATTQHSLRKEGWVCPGCSLGCQHGGGSGIHHIWLRQPTCFPPRWERKLIYQACGCMDDHLFISLSVFRLFPYFFSSIEDRSQGCFITELHSPFIFHFHTRYH